MQTTIHCQEHLKSLTLLYVEDDEDIRDQMVHFLSFYAENLITAVNGMEGLQAYREHTPDIIITDIQMPVMDGITMVREIRSIDKSVPIIVLTAFEQTNYLKASIEAGIARYVTKPVDCGKFREALLECANQLMVEDQLIKAMRSLEQGNSTAKISINGSTKIHKLSESFNMMVDRVIGLVDNTAHQVFELTQEQERAQHNSELIEINRALEKSLVEVSRLSSIRESMYLSVINAMVSTIEASDTYTHGHSARVTSYSLALASKIGLSEERLRTLERACILHDIGKIGIDKSILHKPGKLTNDEYASMQQHPDIAVRILQNIEHLVEVQNIVVKHHERFDGKGYPNGLSGDEIEVEARIISIADTFDAMTSHRPYRKGLPVEVAVDELIKNSGSQFDPELVAQFISLLQDGGLSEGINKERFVLESDRRKSVLKHRIDQIPGHVPINVLVVEDDHLSSLVVRDFLRRKGHEVDEAVTAEAGLRLFAEKRYDLVFLDIGLPDHDGYTVAKGMRLIEQQAGKNPNVMAIICALTSYSMDEAGEKALTSGMNMFVEKPFNLEIMNGVVEMACKVAERNLSMY